MVPEQCAITISWNIIYIMNFNIINWDSLGAKPRVINESTGEILRQSATDTPNWLYLCNSPHRVINCCPVQAGFPPALPSRLLPNTPRLAENEWFADDHGSGIRGVASIRVFRVLLPLAAELWEIIEVHAIEAHFRPKAEFFLRFFVHNRSDNVTETLQNMVFASKTVFCKCEISKFSRLRRATLPAVFNV